MMIRLIGFVALAFMSHGLYAQFTNRYPKVQGYRHHIYLEAYDFPFYSNGPVSPVASPDGKQIAFSAYGWVWLYDRSSRTATRLTRGGNMDFLPTWSVDGKTIAFVRDTRKETLIMSLDLNSKKESLLVDHANASELDPYFSRDGNYLYYASSADGTFDIWRTNLKSGQKEKMTTDNGQELRPVAVATDGSFFCISKSGVVDRIVQYAGPSREIKTAREGRILSQLWFDANTDASQLVFNWPTTTTWELFVENPDKPAANIRLYSDENFVTYPSWNATQESVLFSLAGDDHVFAMYEVLSHGGPAEKIAIDSWDWGSVLKNIKIAVSQSGKQSPARVVIQNEAGHFYIPAGAVARFDSQQGEIYFYTEGEFVVACPAEDRVKIKASHGLLDAVETSFFSVAESGTTQISLPVGWTKPEWYAGEHHFHLNYGGPFKLQPEDLLPILRSEAIDFATPMSANLHFLLKDQEMMNWRRDEFPKIQFGQEVRPHFHGHIGLFGKTDLFWPWFWGPLAYETYTFDDRTTNEVLEFARGRGSVSAYVHPVQDQNPVLNDETLGRLPVGLVADAVNGHLDALEVACLWSDELGSSVAYHHLLNLGLPIALTAGTDAFPGYARCMAIGSSRIYVKVGKPDWDSYLAALKDGKSFVTTGPMIDFSVEGKGPGEFIDAKSNVKWQLELGTANEVDHVQLLCNGKVLWESKDKIKGNKKFSGQVKIPSGGWLAVRVYGPSSQWPLMDSYPFAHSGPVWIGTVGATDPSSKKESAQLLLKALQLSWAKLNAAYAGKQIPQQKAQFQKAKEKLESWAK